RSAPVAVTDSILGPAPNRFLRPGCRGGQPPRSACPWRRVGHATPSGRASAVVATRSWLGSLRIHPIQSTTASLGCSLRPGSFLTQLLRLSFHYCVYPWGK